MHPVRLRLLMTLAGREMTTQQLGEKMPDVASATLYRHMGKLCEVGVIQVVKETPVRGTIEKVYAVCTDAADLTRQELAGITPEDHRRYFNTFVVSLLAQFHTLADSNTGNLIEQGIAYSTHPFFLTDEEYRETVTAIQAALALRADFAPGKGRRRRLISVVIIPDRDLEQELN